MWERIRLYRERQAEIVRLDAYIQREFDGAIKEAKTAQEKYDAGQLAHSITEFERNRLAFLRQESLLRRIKHAPFEVPSDYWNDSPWGMERTLTRTGEAWARAELKRLWRLDVEFWAKLVMPILALIISIIALVKKSR